MKKTIKILPVICCSAFFLFSFGDSMAESNRASHSTSAASLNFKIHIPATLYLQIGPIKQKKDEYSSDVNPAKKTIPVSQDKKSHIMRTSGLISKGGTIFPLK